MKTQEEIIERMIERYIDLESLINYYYQKVTECEENHKWKAKKLFEEGLIEYQAQQREIIRTYGFIFDIEFVDATHQLSDEYVKDSNERGKR